ncbi:hypothetical protein V1478_002133 [Vespula squamosa]|uniref:Uncharacterized protein n=1 Tax=Vespula squamosa TaxID=30214 RepID=A0ABD2BZ35_VESSQ
MSFDTGQRLDVIVEISLFFVNNAAWPLYLEISKMHSVTSSFFDPIRHVACVLGNMQDGFGNSPRELTSSIPVYTFILRLSNVLLPQLPPDADLVKSLTVQCGPVFQEMQDGFSYSRTE